HRLAGRPLLAHVLSTVDAIDARSVAVITGNGADEVEAAVATWPVKSRVSFVRQEPQLGTGHAVQIAAPQLPDDGIALILNGDVPLISAATLRELLPASGGERLAPLSPEMADPTGYRRIPREGDALAGIVDHQDPTARQPAM